MYYSERCKELNGFYDGFMIIIVDDRGPIFTRSFGKADLQFLLYKNWGLFLRPILVWPKKHMILKKL